MRMMLRFSFPAESGNDALRSGKMQAAFQQIMADLKPEAAYLYPEAGQRGGIIVFDMEKESDIAKAAEPFWFALGADVELTPVMTPDDLMAALGEIDDIRRKYDI
jgi:hypothetical protein